MRVAVIGQGYVGLTIAMGAAEVGHNVLGIEKNLEVVSNLNLGKSHIEGIKESQLTKLINLGFYRVSSQVSEIKNVDIVIFALPTPLSSDGTPDLEILENACDEVAPFLDARTLVINESTSFIGTLRNIIAKRINGINSNVIKFAISPERVDPGNEHYGICNTPRLVAGISEEAREAAVKFYSSFCDRVISVSSPEVAEASKLLENSFRFINIGFVNEFTQIMNALDVPVAEVIKSAATKPFGFMSFYPSAGIGGHCIPVDPMYLQKNAIDIDLPSKYVEISKKVNQEMPDHLVERLIKFHGNLNGKKILVVGVSYKPNIADTRESSAKKIITNLRLRGANVKWHDPLVSEFMGENSTPPGDKFDLTLVLVQHAGVDLRNWLSGPIYCVNQTFSHKGWIPLL